MAHSVLLTGGLLILIVLVMNHLQPQGRPPLHWRSRVATGLVAGLISALVADALQQHAPSLGVVAYPTATAFVGLYLGPLASATCAVVALLGLTMADGTVWAPPLLVMASAMAIGAAWRWMDARFPRTPWLSIVGLAATLPLITRLCLHVSGAVPAPDSPAAWAQKIPWSHGSGVLLMGLVRQFLEGRARAAHALHVAHQQLAEREEQLQLAMKSLGGGRWAWDVPHRAFQCFGDFYEAFGITARDANAPDLWQRWYDRRHPADAERNASLLQNAMDGQVDTYESEFRVRDNQGRWRWVLSRGVVSRRDADGRAMGMIGMDVDISANRDAEDALRISEAKYTTFYQTLPDPAGISRVSDGCYVDVNPAFCEVFGLSREDIIGRTSTELKIWANDSERARLLEVFGRDGKVDRLPMFAQQRGTPIPGLMSARSVMVDGDNCFVFVFHDMTDVQRASDELRSVNGLLQQAGRLARLGAWEAVRGKGLVYWSDVCFEIHGLPQGSPMPHDYISTHVAPPYRDLLRQQIRSSVRERREWSMEMEVLRADGRPFWVRARGEPVVENGRVERVRGVMQDIDDSRRSEQRLRQSEDRFSRIFHLMPYPMGLSHRSDGRYVDINPAWEQLLGIPRAQAIGRTAIEMGIFTAQERSRLIAHVDATGQLDSYELTIRVPGGQSRTVLQSMRATEFDGEPCWLFSVHDITDRKRSEEQVREREELLSLTLSAASLGRWDWNLQTGTVTGDSRWHAMRGLPDPGPSDAPPAAPSPWSQGISPHDIDRIDSELARHTLHPATPFDATWRMTAQGESPRWIRNLGKIVGFDAQGRAERMLGVSIDVTPQREQEVLLQRMALYDALTGLPNRVLLARKLQDSMEQARRKGHLLGVTYLDLDGFKPVNDRLGHGTGDRLLVMVAGRLTRALRPIDTVARLGGDEFVILMPELQSLNDVEGLLNRVMENISLPYVLDAEHVVVTASIGYTVFPMDEADADALMRHADQAMYTAKQAGRNRFHQFDAAQERAQQTLREQARHVREALADHQFLLYLQPKVDMRSGTVVGAEALARWQHPEHGVVGPGAFLPLLEGSEMEIRFGEWVIDAALDILERLQVQGCPVPVSVNVAAQHLQQPGFSQWVAACLARHPRVAAQRVEIEITESAALYDLNAVADTLRALRALGITVSLDDFGTGYSSLTYLRRLPMDTLKIDQSFVHGMMSDPGDLAIVQGVIGLSRSFGYRVIAEGVETVEQGQMLLQLGCNLAQGYCIARPMPPEDFMAWAPRWQPPPGWQRGRPL